MNTAKYHACTPPSHKNTCMPAHTHTHTHTLQLSCSSRSVNDKDTTPAFQLIKALTSNEVEMMISCVCITWLTRYSPVSTFTAKVKTSRCFVTLRPVNLRPNLGQIPEGKKKKKHSSFQTSWISAAIQAGSTANQNFVNKVSVAQTRKSFSLDVKKTHIFHCAYCLSDTRISRCHSFPGKKLAASSLYLVPNGFEARNL